MKKFKYILSAVAVLSVLHSCVNDDDLEQHDPNVETEANFWKNDEDGVLGVNSVYQGLLYDGTYMRSTPLLLDARADDMHSKSPWGAMFTTGKFTTVISDESIYGWAFREYYQGIYRANQVLLNVPNIQFENEELKNRVIGQAYFMRGLYFFHLVNLFKSVPLPTNTELYHPQRSNEEGWAQVISDFSNAVDLLPVSYNNVTGLDQGHVGRATKGAALAYLGKSYLFTKDYQKAKESFESVINLGVYSLVSNYRDNFTDVNENNSESIFEIQFSRTVGGIDLGWIGAPGSSWGKTTGRAVTYGPPGFGFNDIQPTKALLTEFQQELTKDGELDPRLDATVFYNKPGTKLYGQDFATYYANNSTNLNDVFTRKYQNSDGQYADEYDWRSGINERLMRYADVLMMYAECLNELGNTTGAYTYIQMVRDRVNLPNLATVKPNMSTEQMRDQIAHERFLEFALEGHRFDDIRRWGWLNDTSKLNWLKSRDDEFNTYSPGREYYPIPLSEIDNNPNGIVQNSGW